MLVQRQLETTLFQINVTHNYWKSQLYFKPTKNMEEKNLPIVQKDGWKNFLSFVLKLMFVWTETNGTPLKHQLLEHQQPKHQLLKHRLSKTSTVRNIEC
jgi:hypothetical protein